MNVFAYFIYAVVLFALYASYMLGGEMFYNYILPWIIFIVFLFAPLIWNFHRQSGKNNGI